MPYFSICPNLLLLQKSDTTCINAQKQKAEFDIYIYIISNIYIYIDRYIDNYLYIYIYTLFFLIGDDMSILKTEKSRKCKPNCTSLVTAQGDIQ